MRLAIIVSEFNDEITAVMKATALEEAARLKAKVVKIYSVPGTYDSPFALKKALARKDVDAAVVLGAVVKGETDHDRVVVEVAGQKISQLSLEYEKPVGFGVIGPNVSWSKAKTRAAEYAKRAVQAAVKLLKLR